MGQGGRHGPPLEAGAIVDRGRVWRPGLRFAAASSISRHQKLTLGRYLMPSAVQAIAPYRFPATQPAAGVRRHVCSARQNTFLAEHRPILTPPLVLEWL